MRRLAHHGLNSASDNNYSKNLKSNYIGFAVNVKGHQLTIPNFITIFRLFLVPIIIWTLLLGEMKWALLIFLIAGVSDGLDGYIARKFNQSSELGAYIDPIADKALLVSSFVVLSYSQLLPLWFAILVVSRDVLIIAGVLLAFIMGKPVKMKPLMVSKVNTTAQILFILMVLVLLAFPDWLQNYEKNDLIKLGSIVVATFTSISAIAYMVGWLRHISK